MKMHNQNQKFSLAVFPFLKTKKPVTIGKILFSSTDDTNGLTAEQKVLVDEIVNMLFLKDNLQIKAASYAFIPYIDMDHPRDHFEKLKNIQAFVAYIYASPRHEFGDIFLAPETASMAVFSPGKISKSLVSPHDHVEEVQKSSELIADERGEIDGYAGMYNFKHPFWVSRGSRLYGPIPNPSLNNSQNLCATVGIAKSIRCDYRLLYELLTKEKTNTSERVFNALQWFNAANSEANTHAAAIVDLSIAFESMLALPSSEKTDRFVDTISLLLGRIPRLQDWARQFYDTRSQIVHAGDSQVLKFIVKESSKTKDWREYQSLLSYGRQIFQLCLGTLLTGADLAENSNLADKFFTNGERFLGISRILSDNKVEPFKRLESIAPIISAVEQYRYVSESNFKLDPMIDSVHLAAKTLLECQGNVTPIINTLLMELVNSKKTSDHFIEMEVIGNLSGTLKSLGSAENDYLIEVFRNLVDAVWRFVAIHFFWLKENKLDLKRD
ncbi:MAG: HEPN domain-containing protein [Candidatus Wallbacteria bacterium]|nr:HEPN domain-containing protein [Candidatus Wallbacteria bacterium]